MFRKKPFEVNFAYIAKLGKNRDAKFRVLIIFVNI